MSEGYEKIIFGENGSRHYDSFEGRLLPIVSMKMIWDRTLYCDEYVLNAEAAINLVSEFILDCPNEYGMCIALDSNSHPICVGLLAIGSQYTVALDARNVMQFALVSGAAQIIVLHNHPTYSKDGNMLKPSMSDIRTTDIIRRACDLCRIELYDSIVVGRKSDENGKIKPVYYSMREQKTKGIKFTKRKEFDIDSNLNHLRFPGGAALAEKEEEIDWVNKDQSSDKYWTYTGLLDMLKKEVPTPDLKTIPQTPIYVAYSPEDMPQMMKDAAKDIETTREKENTDHEHELN